MICSEADRIITKLNASEKRFFETLLGDNYFQPEERGRDWQTEREIRSELRQELEGDEYEFNEPQEFLEEEPSEETERRLHWMGEDAGYMKSSSLPKVMTQLKQTNQDIEIEL